MLIELTSTKLFFVLAICVVNNTKSLSQMCWSGTEIQRYHCGHRSQGKLIKHKCETELSGLKSRARRGERINRSHAKDD